MNKVIIIDNYDSFTWNLYQYFRKIGGIVEVKRCDDIKVMDLDKFSLDRLVISPGPGTPDNANISVKAVEYFYEKVPIFGVCLGHQIIAQFFGAKLKLSKQIMHGKSSVIKHIGYGVFSGLTQFLKVIRYHSWVVDVNTIPVCLEVTAWSVCEDRNVEIMGIRHRSLFVEGVQFHPESVLTEKGYCILSNFMKY